MAQTSSNLYARIDGNNYYFPCFDAKVSQHSIMVRKAGANLYVPLTDVKNDEHCIATRINNTTYYTSLKPRVVVNASFTTVFNSYPRMNTGEIVLDAPITKDLYVKVSFKYKYQGQYMSCAYMDAADTILKAGSTTATLSPPNSTSIAGISKDSNGDLMAFIATSFDGDHWCYYRCASTVNEGSSTGYDCNVWARFELGQADMDTTYTGTVSPVATTHTIQIRDPYNIPSAFPVEMTFAYNNSTSDTLYRYNTGYTFKDTSYCTLNADQLTNTSNAYLSVYKYVALISPSLTVENGYDTPFLCQPVPGSGAVTLRGSVPIGRNLAWLKFKNYV